MSAREVAKELLRTYQPKKGDKYGARVFESIRAVAAGEGSPLLCSSIENLHTALRLRSPILRLQAEDSVIRWSQK